MKKYPAIVEQIHHEFNSAGELLLQEANKVLSSCAEKNIDKGLRLQKLGFVNTQEAINVKEIEQIKKTAAANADLVRHYSIRYPNYKFITDEMVDRICKKYRLVNAPVDRFKGFVPSDKLTQIEDAKIDTSDFKVPEIIIKQAWHGIARNSLFIKSLGASNIHKYLGLERIPIDHPKLKKSGNTPYSVYENGENAYIEKYELFEFKMSICAPAKDFNLKGLKKFGFNFLASKIVHCPDPVVLYPVKGGQLILAAWGDEASDELVVNQKFN